MYVKSLEEGQIPWEKMWKTRQPYNAISKTKYHGINNLILSFIGMKRGYKDVRWCTYNQMKKINGVLRIMLKEKEFALNIGVLII